ncbi:MAG: helix-turn-helix domain-containing protein [Deltaproteobacteria bacterium]|nr:helix-turn-helix domain-containing protein [Deltaproteobacteria bacterium]
MNKFDFSIIRTLRTKWGITAEELARRANLTRATIAKLEGGDSNPTIETIEALSRVFQLTSSELIRLAEVAHCEEATTKVFQADGFAGTHIWFPHFEAYHIRAVAGVRKDSDMRLHENTAEICLVLSGKVRVTVRGKSHELGPGMALRFKALYEHHFDIVDNSEFLLIHHNVV